MDSFGYLIIGVFIIFLVGVILFLCYRQKTLTRDSKELLWLLKTDFSEYYKNGEIKGMVPPRAERILYKMQELMQSQYSLQLIEKQIEYSALQSQINPHFLYNTLEAIRSQALLNNQTEIALMTEKLARFFRYCISNREDIVTIRDEINNIRDYFFIQQYRFENRFSLEIIYNEEDDSFDKVIPKMTLQPVVENAIFHGLEQKKGSGTVTIRILQTRSKIYIVISDDGVGMQEEQVLSMNQRLQNLGIKADETVSYRKGIALSNVNNRLKLYFGEEYGLRISSIIGQGTDLEICIPGRELREVQRRM